jgi:adenine deaminase
MVHVIGALDGQLVTESLRRPASVHEGRLRSDPAADVLTIAVVDRYDDRPPALGLVANFGLGTSAIASSVAHDSHNIVAVGGSESAIARAVNLLIDCRGGLAAVGQGREAVLPLPIAGLMSDRPGIEVAAGYAAVTRLAREFGSRLDSPFMTLAFMSLLVIPALKLAPMGPFDVERFAPVDLFVRG